MQFLTHLIKTWPVCPVYKLFLKYSTRLIEYLIFLYFSSTQLNNRIFYQIFCYLTLNTEKKWNTHDSNNAYHFCQLLLDGEPQTETITLLMRGLVWKGMKHLLTALFVATETIGNISRHCKSNAFQCIQLPCWYRTSCNFCNIHNIFFFSSLNEENGGGFFFKSFIYSSKISFSSRVYSNKFSNEFNYIYVIYYLYCLVKTIIDLPIPSSTFQHTLLIIE